MQNLLLIYHEQIMQEKLFSISRPVLIKESIRLNDQQIPKLLNTGGKQTLNQGNKRWLVKKGSWIFQSYFWKYFRSALYKERARRETTPQADEV